MNGTRRKTACVLNLILLVMIQESPAQVAGDTVPVNYDSIQDVRMDRLERLTTRQLNLLEERGLGQEETIDSLGVVFGVLQDEILELDRERAFQAENIRQLELDIEKAAATSLENQAKMRNTLWISGTFFLLLLLASFLVLFVYGLNTRNLVDRLRRRQKRIRRSFIQDLERQEEVILDALTTQNVKIREEMDQQQSTLRATIKHQKKNLRNEIRSRNKSSRKRTRKQKRS